MFIISQIEDIVEKSNRFFTGLIGCVYGIMGEVAIFLYKGGVFVPSASLEAVLTQLNASQQDAVTHPPGPVAVFAGPGSGKTTVLTRRILYLVEQGASPERIMVVTFTRAAAAEMRQRLVSLMGCQWTGRWLGTFHSIFLSMLRQEMEYIPRILSEGEQSKWIRQLLEDGEEPIDDEAVSTLLNKIGLCKGNGILPQQLKVKKQKNILFQKQYLAYEELKREQGVWDYDDILLAVYRLLSSPEKRVFWQRKWDHILVDEFQDINKVQYEVISSLAKDHGNLFVVGDDDQSIYGFRGSDPRLMLELSKSFPQLSKVVLSTNYRSTEPIIALSQRLISRNQQREQKEVRGTGRKGAKPEWMVPEDEEMEAKEIIARLQDNVETAVLYRTSSQARAIIDALVQADIPFAVAPSDAGFYRRWQIVDILSYLRLAEDPNDWEALQRIINRPKRYLYSKDWGPTLHNIAREKRMSLLAGLPSLPNLQPYQYKRLEEMVRLVSSLPQQGAEEAIKQIRLKIGYDRFLSQVAKESGNELQTLLEPVEELTLASRKFASGRELLEHVKRVEEVVQSQPAHPPFQLMTFHKEKGFQFERVFLLGLNAGVLPYRRTLQQVSKENRDLVWEEERRLLYVGITRARNQLVLSSSRNFGGRRIAPSPFLMEMGFGVEENPQKKERRAKESRSRVKVELSTSPQYSFSGEEIQPGDEVEHTRWGTGEILEVERITEGEPWRKVVVRFAQDRKTLHYELARKMGILTLKK